MASDVVVPFPRSRARRNFQKRGFDMSSPMAWGPPPASERTRLWSRLSTARDVVRGVVETLSYLRDARVRPPAPPALPPARSAK